MSVKRHVVCLATELPVGTRRIFEVDGRSIGVFNLQGRLYALRNVCPHRYAPLCEGPLTGLVTADRPGKFVFERAGEVVRCPWHGWEFDIRTGQSVFNPNRMRTKTYAACFERSPTGIAGCSATQSAEEGVETFPASLEAEQVVVYL